MSFLRASIVKESGNNITQTYAEVEPRESSGKNVHTTSSPTSQLGSLRKNILQNYNMLRLKYTISLN